jgi:hypothetical protein
LAYRDGTAVQWQPQEPLAAPWKQSAYNEPDATRVNVSFAPSQEVLSELKSFDDWSVEA